MAQPGLWLRYPEIYVKHIQHLGLKKEQWSNGFEGLNFDLKTLGTCKLFEVNEPSHDFTHVDLIAEAGLQDLSREHLLETLQFNTGEKIHWY